MENEINILLKAFEVEWNGARHQENQRSTMINYIITVSAAAVGFQVQKGFTPRTWPISFFLIALGIYGLISSLKFYERFMFHVRRATKIKYKLDMEYCHSKIYALMRQVDQKQRSEYKLLNQVRLYFVWCGPPLVSLIIGIIILFCIF